MQKKSSTTVNGRDKLPPTTTPDKPSKLQKFLDFESEIQTKRDKLRQEAENEAKEDLDQALANWETIKGKHYILSEADYQKLTAKPTTGKRGRPAGATNKTKTDVPAESSKYNPDKTCKKCDLTGHESKAHNLAEGFKDKRFSDEELRKRGYWPPDGKLISSHIVPE